MLWHRLPVARAFCEDQDRVARASCQDQEHLDHTGRPCTMPMCSAVTDLHKKNETAQTPMIGSHDPAYYYSILLNYASWTLTQPTKQLFVTTLHQSLLHTRSPKAKTSTHQASDEYVNLTITWQHRCHGKTGTDCTPRWKAEQLTLITLTDMKPRQGCFLG